jgi:hypothetical protein
MTEQSFRRRLPVGDGPAMAGQANDKIQMSNKIQNPNVIKLEKNSPSMPVLKISLYNRPIRTSNQ